MIKDKIIQGFRSLNLHRQLVVVTLVALVISVFSFGVLVPKMLNPFYEQNIYEILYQNAMNISINNDEETHDNITYIIKTRGGGIYTSNNIYEVFKDEITIDEMLEFASGQMGKFKYMGETYYYRRAHNGSIENIVYTNSELFYKQEKALFAFITPIMTLTIIITTSLTFAWSNHVVSKIKRLKKKTEQMISDDYKEGQEFYMRDELNMLNKSIDATRKSLKIKEEYKNFMFQNLSHELKTPISVIDSYVEAMEDNMVDTKTGLNVIKEENNKLKQQVNTILQFNKIDYMKEQKEYSNNKVDILTLINRTLEKYKVQTKNVNYEVVVKTSKKKEIMYNGTEDMWQMVFDNILGNFTRYAKTLIRIEISSKCIKLYNDGENIEEELLSHLFTPYVKGKKGSTGLGLSIAKRTVNLFGYELSVKNEQDGVTFIIQ